MRYQRLQIPLLFIDETFYTIWNQLHFNEVYTLHGSNMTSNESVSIVPIIKSKKKKKNRAKERIRNFETANTRKVSEQLTFYSKLTSITNIIMSSPSPVFKGWCALDKGSVKVCLTYSIPLVST